MCELRATFVRMKGSRSLGTLAAYVLCSGLSAQSFDLEQFDQLFRPRLRMDARWTPELAFQEGALHYEERSAAMVFTVPVYKRWSAGINLKPQGESLGELLKDAVRVRASQVMANARLGTRQLLIGDEVRNLHSLSFGALGISLTKKYRVLFWSANVNVSEEESTFDQAVPRFNGLIGKMHVKGTRKQFFYGLTATVSDGLNVPLPFIGGVAPMGERWSFQYVLPLQVALGYKASQQLRFQVGVGGDGYRSGFAQGDGRVNMNYTALRVFANVRHKVSRYVQLRAEVSGLASHSIRLPDADDGFERFPIDPGMQVMVGANFFFGQSTLERIMEDVLK